MKKHFFKFVLLLGGICVSCSNETDMKSPCDIDRYSISEGNVIAENTLQMLSFESQKDFNIIIENPDSYLKEHEDFYSLYDEYEAAWEVEEEYYISLEKYQEFKKRFSHLLFPEYEDDYSFFLPVSNENVAKLLNIEGKVCIGGKVMDYRDIRTAEDLLRLGRLSSKFDSPLSKSPIGSWDNPYMNYIPELVGPEGDRKFWVNVGKRVNGNVAEMWIEINFRKKGAFGRWKNYSSNASFVGQLRFANGRIFTFPVSSEKEGRSPIIFDAFAPAANAFPCKGTKCEVWYQGYPGTTYMNVDM